MIIIYSLRIIVLPCKINEILYYNPAQGSYGRRVSRSAVDGEH